MSTGTQVKTLHPDFPVAAGICSQTVGISMGICSIQSIACTIGIPTVAAIFILFGEKT